MAWQWPAAAQQARLNEPGTKSELVILAERFQDSFCATAGSAASEFNLSEAAQQLAVSRRRLYDIVNVLEPLQMVARTGKLTYQWKGVAHLPDLMKTLHEEAMAGAQPHIAAGHLPGSCWVLALRFVQQLLLDCSALPLTTIAERMEQLSSAAAAAAATANSSAEHSSSARANGAAGRGSTTERRLYDIGSVLSTFALCAKTLQGGSGPRHRQPVYQWTYPWQELRAAAGASPTGSPAAAAAVQTPAAAAAAAGGVLPAGGAATTAAAAGVEDSACCRGTQALAGHGQGRGFSTPGIALVAGACSDCVSEDAAAAADVLCCLGGANSEEMGEAVTSTLAAAGGAAGTTQQQPAAASSSCGCGASCKCCSGEGCGRSEGAGGPGAEAVAQRLQLVDLLLQVTQSCVLQHAGTGCCSAVLQKTRGLLQSAEAVQVPNAAAGEGGCSGQAQQATAGCGSSSGGTEFSDELQGMLQQVHEQHEQFVRAPAAAVTGAAAAAAGPEQQQQQQQQQQPEMGQLIEEALQPSPEEQAGPSGTRRTPVDTWCLPGVEPEGLCDLRINSGTSNDMNNAERLAALQQLPEGCPAPGQPQASPMDWGPLEDEVEEGGLEPPSKRRMR